MGTGNEPRPMLLDIETPKMNGLEVLRAPQGSQPPPIVLLTSNFEVCREQALQLGAARAGEQIRNSPSTTGC